MVMETEEKSANRGEIFMKIEKKDYTFEELLDIIYLLRGENGCPWDRKQTHESVKMNLIEEAYEAIEALDSGDKDKFADELGDVMLQVVFQASIGKDEGTFTITDVLNHVCNKMITRHTHIFGDDKAGDAAEALANWEKNKVVEKGLNTFTESLSDVCKYLPALIRAQKVQSKAAKVGFDWNKVEDAIAKTKEELGELEVAIEQGKTEHIEDELGDLIFSAVNIARFVKVNPEVALTGTINKFIQRFAFIEEEAKKLDLELEDMSLEEMDKLWEQAKSKSK